MNIEIVGVGFVNKGAELMYCAIKEKVRHKYPDANIVLNCNSRKDWRLYTDKGIFKKLHLRKKGINFGDIGRFIPRSLRSKYNIITDDSIDLVLDASGFAYGDTWGPEYAIKLNQSLKNWKPKETKTILLPQAFGAFDDDITRREVTKMINTVDYVYVRDEVSLNFVRDLDVKNKNISLKPDFTILLEGVKDKKYEKYRGAVGIIPNSKVVQKSNVPLLAEEKYINTLSYLIRRLLENELPVFLLNHEGEKDLLLALQVQKRFPEIDIISESDPLKIKGIIGNAYATIGSRFHGLVSALSQNIPSLAIGWSHKYEMLFRDFSFSEGVVPSDASQELLDEKLKFITESMLYDKTKSDLQESSARLKNEAESMWNEIFNMSRIS